jgi:ankyrin repeat protein
MGSESRGCKEAKRREKMGMFSEEATKELVDLMNDCLKDSDSEAVIELVLAGANPNAKNKGRTVLHLAAWHGHLELSIY